MIVNVDMISMNTGTIGTQVICSNLLLRKLSSNMIGIITTIHHDMTVSAIHTRRYSSLRRRPITKSPAIANARNG